MKLLIDAGNTRIKWCWFDGKELPPVYECAEHNDLDSQGVSLFQVDRSEVDEVLICNVGGEVLAESLHQIFADWQLSPEFVRSTRQCGSVVNAYKRPEQLGTDRWMALLGAWSIRRDAVCIVDCGTAVTIDVLDSKGRHLGGIIVPGIELMQDVLRDQTGGINLDDASESDSSSGLLAADTGNAIEAGTLYALVALIDRVQLDIATELEIDLPLLINGGDAELVQPLLSCNSAYEPMLIFQGILATIETQREYK